MTHQFIVHTAFDGTVTFKEVTSGKAIAYMGSPIFISQISIDQGWKAYGSPTFITGDFIAIHPDYAPEQLPINSGEERWIRMTVDELLDFANGELQPESDG